MNAANIAADTAARQPTAATAAVLRARGMPYALEAVTLAAPGPGQVLVEIRACGICHTLPPALRERNAAIVLGHGLFATGQTEFNEAFAALLDTENACRAEYFQRVRDLGG